MLENKLNSDAEKVPDLDAYVLLRVYLHPIRISYRIKAMERYSKNEMSIFGNRHSGIAVMAV